MFSNHKREWHQGNAIAEVGRSLGVGFDKVSSSISEQTGEIRRVADATLAVAASLSNIGLDRLSDEMERKRKSEEYYLLLERIEDLEVKIVARGGNLAEIYEKVNSDSYKEAINLTELEVRMLVNAFSGKEQQKWLRATCRLYHISPVEIFNQLWEDASIGYRVVNPHSYKDRRIWLVAYPSNGLKAPLTISKVYEVESGSENYKDDIGGYVLDPLGQPMKYVFGKLFNIMNGEKVATLLSDGQTIALDDEHKTKILEAMKNFYENKEFDTATELEEILDFSSFIAEINCEIMLNNLRAIHVALLEEYRKIKLKKED